MSNICSVEVLVNDRPVTTYSHDNDTYIEGRPGSSYKIRLTNRTYQRIKVIVSVDGLSVMDGKPAGSNTQGYVINGYDSLVIDGWRTSMDSVATFEFGSKRHSYSAESGQGTSNVGVIGVQVFREYQYVPTKRYFTAPVYYDGYANTFDHGTWNIESSSLRGIAISTSLNVGYNSADGDDTFVAMASAAPINNVGTEFGQEVESKVVETNFIPRSNAADQLFIVYYDDRRGLEARGIYLGNSPKKRPNPFPADKNFCQRPVRYRG